ncbi:LuxR C-terminal-related transcriptional regulator [Pseudonocardia sp. KRD291]|uniref:helix-turn-helix transcriptional regulator n=1 Tax=Pseudonocardia sp. KRD291 TaxID=2792007 RepID=UPI001C49E7F5|nr:LuxR C-terminal-related transcriptional regulator [Pseudonocardia sp. KRD291]MBW0106767.1 LuxR family transcriptional regulator [Pseudonocardia sp. KRD291]
MGGGWPLVGRAATLHTIVSTARSGRRAGMVLVGPPGVGRTRLARAALAAVCGGPGWSPSWVMAGRSTSSIPLGAMSHLFPELDPGGVPTARLLREARRHLHARAGGARVVLAVDDAHVLDETSAILLEQLAVSGDAFVIVTAPSGVVVPAPVFALWKEGLADRLDIGELDRGQSDRLVVHAMCDDEPGTIVDGGALAHLWRLSRGNPLFLRELVDGGRDAGTLHRVGAVWRWEGPFPGTPRLSEMIDAQTGDLDPAELDLMRLLAFGQPLDSEVAVALFSADVLASAERRGLLRSTQDGQRVDLHLTHPLHTEILRGRSTPLQEREIYHRLSDAVAALGHHHARDRARLVSWQAAQGLSADPDELLTVALDMHARNPALAERLLAAAAEQEAGPAARLRLACAQIRLGHPEPAEAVLAELTGPYGRDEQGRRADDLRLDVAVVRVHNLYWGLRAFDRAAEVLEEAIGDAPAHDGDPPARTVLRAFRALVDSRPAEAVRVIAPVADGAGAALPALAVAAMAAARAGSYGAAIGYARRARPTSLAVDDGAGGWLHFELLAAWWYALMQSGDLDAADGVALPCHRDALERGLDRYAALFGTWLGIVAGRRGRCVTAASRLLEAAAAVPAAGFSFAMPLVGELAPALASTGRAGRARDVLAEGERNPGDMLLAGWAHPARVFLAGVEGRTTHAATIALTAAGDTETRGHRLQALHAAVRLGVTGEVTDRLVELTAGVESPLERAYGEHARALAARDGAGLDAVAVRFAGLGMRLLAAEAAAQAAQAHRGAGRLGSAAAAASRSRAWAQDCEGARTPALALLDSSDDLTPREHEIAALAATGMTSKAIAGELVVSVRTVDNVLRSVYAKLGVSGRGDLVQVAGIRPGP